MRVNTRRLLRASHNDKPRGWRFSTQHICNSRCWAHLSGVLRKHPFIGPMAPSAVQTPPIGPEWSHEAKFDGWRVQIHIEDGDAAIFSRNGADLTKRFRALLPALSEIPARRAIIDAELVACGEDGMPSFRLLMGYGKARAPLCLWAFDLLHLNGVYIMPLPLDERREFLAELIASADTEHIQFSGTFEDPIKLLATCERA